MDFSRKISIIGDIDENSYKEFVESLDGITEILDGDDIYIELLSHGGDAVVALAYYDRIRAIKGKVHINAIGTISSAAVVILAAGDVRTMTENAWVMVHEDVVVFEMDNPRVSQVEKNAETGRRLEDQWNTLLASRTKATAEAWAALHKEEAHLNAKQCLKLGLISKIV